ncbi:50S ribosomal protein L9 [bacterium 1xD8-6]|jgi:ribosomal protein L9|nr:50S ribosomal protein L9 [bacterium D16-36]RKI64874.1 50S ribosomal protein L9 [bacterium 1xD8-6]
MEIILLEDVKSLGKKGDMVNVSEGYARNFLLKKKMGVEATAKNKNDLKLQKQHEEKVAKEKLEEAKAFAEELKEKSITVSIKTGSGGRSFGSVSTKELAAAAKEQLGYDLDKKKMVLDVPIKSPGIFTMPIKLHPKVTGELKVIVKEA